MKLLHIIPTYVPAFRYGGPARSVYGLAEALGRTGVTVEVWTTDLDGPTSLTIPKGLPFPYPHHTARYFPVRAFRRWHWSAELASALVCAEAEVVHLHSVFLYPTWVGRRWAEGRRIPFLLSPRGMLDPELIAARGSFRKRLMLALMERRTVCAARRIVATSVLEAEQIRRLRLATAPIVEIPNGVNLEEWEPPREEALGEEVKRVLSRGRFVLFFGRLDRKKGLEHLLEAIAKHRGIRLVVAGPDERGLGTELDRKARELELGEQYQRLNLVLGAERVALLRAASLLVLPSVSENFGNVVVEAMACGVPVLTTSGVGAAVHVKQAEAGWVIPPACPEALSDALKQAIQLPSEELRRRGENGRSYVKRKLTWDQIAAQALAIYRTVQREERR